MDFDTLSMQELKSRLTEKGVILDQSKSYTKSELVLLLGSKISEKIPVSAPSVFPPKNSGVPAKTSRLSSGVASPVKNIGYQEYKGMKLKQSTNLFELRMNESFSQANIQSLQKETDTSQSSLIKRMVVFTLLSALFLLTVLTLLNYKTIRFCGDGILENCLPCPQNAICQKGQVFCIHPYIQEGYECVEDKSVVQEAWQLIGKIEEHVIQESRNSFVDSRTEFSLAFNQALELFPDHPSHVSEKALTLLRKGESKRIKIIDTDSSRLNLVAIDGYLGLVDNWIIFWQDNKFVIIGSFLAMLFIIKRIDAYFEHKRLIKNVENLYTMVREQLRENVDDSYEHGILEDQIIKSIEEKFGKNLGKKIFPMIEKLRKDDPSVCKFQTSIAGRPKVLWQWKEDIPASIGSKMKLI